MDYKMEFSERLLDAGILDVTHPFMTGEESLASQMTMTDKRQCVN